MCELCNEITTSCRQVYFTYKIFIHNKIYHVNSIWNLRYYGISSEKYKNIDDFTF